MTIPEEIFRLPYRSPPPTLPFVNSTLELVKKAGAGLIVLILIGMMGITFSSQPISEITEIISGQSGPGEFNGKEISKTLVNLAVNQCKDRYRGMGNIPDYFLNNCVTSELKNLVALPSLGKKLGLGVSESAVEEELMKQVRENHRSQDAVADPDDRLDIREIYNRELQYNPLDVRKALESSRKTYEALREFPVSTGMKSASANLKKITMNVDYIRYTTADLLRSLGKEVQVSEEEIRETYEKEQAGKTDEEKRPFEKEKELIENRIRTEKRQVELAGLKAQLGKLGDSFQLEQVEQITGLKQESAGEVPLERLRQVPTKSGAPLDLVKPEILTSLPPGGKSLTAGPYVSGESTYYVKISNVRTPGVPMTAFEIDEIAGQRGSYHAAYLLEMLVENEAKRGNFRVFLFKEEDS